LCCARPPGTFPRLPARPTPAAPDYPGAPPAAVPACLPPRLPLPARLVPPRTPADRYPTLPYRPTVPVFRPPFVAGPLPVRTTPPQYHLRACLPAALQDGLGTPLHTPPLPAHARLHLPLLPPQLPPWVHHSISPPDLSTPGPRYKTLPAGVPLRRRVTLDGITGRAILVTTLPAFTALLTDPGSCPRLPDAPTRRISAVSRPTQTVPLIWFVRGHVDYAHIRVAAERVAAGVSQKLLWTARLRILVVYRTLRTAAARVLVAQTWRTGCGYGRRIRTPLYRLLPRPATISLPGPAHPHTTTFPYLPHPPHAVIPACAAYYLHRTTCPCHTHGSAIPSVTSHRITAAAATTLGRLPTYLCSILGRACPP